MQKGGKQANPVYAAALRYEMQQGCLFLKSSLIKKYSSISIGRIYNLQSRGCKFMSGLLFHHLENGSLV